MAWLMARLDGVERVVGRLAGVRFGPMGQVIVEKGRTSPVQRESAEPAPTGAWAELTPIQRAVSDMPLVAPTPPFRAELGAGNPPPPILAPLAHGRGLEAPSGLVLGIARAVVPTVHEGG